MTESPVQGSGLAPGVAAAQEPRRVPRIDLPVAFTDPVDRPVPGIAEAVRAYSRDKVPAAALSRGLAGVAGRTLIVNLPGSTGGAKDGLAVLGPILAHAVQQVRGGDHG